MRPRFRDSHAEPPLEPPDDDPEEDVNDDEAARDEYYDAKLHAMRDGD